ncbi:hypothetical protein OKW18_000886 [Streptomyces pratensis]|jgi:hypothetical protein|nr:hypothetical protein [Streptomyces pratensis]
MVLLPHAQGQGYGPDVARALVRHLLAVVGWDRAPVDPEADNRPAIRAWSKAGFRPVASRRSQALMECRAIRNGAPRTAQADPRCEESRPEPHVPVPAGPTCIPTGLVVPRRPAGFEQEQLRPSPDRTWAHRRGRRGVQRRGPRGALVGLTRATRASTARPGCRAAACTATCPLADAWHQTKRLTEYVTAVRDHATSLPPRQERTEIEVWLAFTDARLQHLTESAAAPKLPTPPQPSGDDLKPFLGPWSPYGPRF